MDYFQILNNGIYWKIQKGQEHKDDIEMSGFMSSFIVAYGVLENGDAYFSRYSVFPTLRTIPNDTHASLRKEFDENCFPKFIVNEIEQNEKAVSVFFDGILTVETETDCLNIIHEFFPTIEHLANAERITVTNKTKNDLHLTLNTPEKVRESLVKGCKGIYILEVLHDIVDIVLNPNEKITFGVFSQARIANKPLISLDINKEYDNRKLQIKRILGNLKLESDNKELDLMFKLSAIRAGESIFHTICGDIHSPGGKNFYAASWCNDQLEYAAPWFAMTGEKIAVKATENAFMAYSSFMCDEFLPIPSSVINEGLDIWDGAGDRGDAAMYLYGGSFLLLFRQDNELTNKLWKYIKWSAEYCIKNTSDDGVICSDTDELENRFPTDGHANLSTSCICYGGLKMAAKIAKILGEEETYKQYNLFADNLFNAIENHFGDNLHNFNTYKYSNGIKTLRSWICLPLCVGIDTRADDTVNALFSKYLWNGNGIYTCELGNENQNETVWDRSTLFGFKGAMIAGYTDKIWNYFEAYIHARLLGERVPYAVEAYPESGMRHLSGESCLFCRIIPEGILRLKCIDKNQYSITPYLPHNIHNLKLSGLNLAGKEITVNIFDDINCEVICEEKVIATGKCDNNIVFNV